MHTAGDMEEYSIDLDKPIDLKDEVNSGAYGAVYKVKLNGAPCVAKRLHDILTGMRGKERVSEKQWRQLSDRFAQECRLLSGMRHPNVVQFLGTYRPSKDPRDLALVMEEMFMDLEGLVTNHPQTPFALKLHILRDVSCGLMHIHSHGVIHRDLNSGNVLLTQSLLAKVADFGVARVIDQSAPAGKLTVVPGAPDYMPPETYQPVPQYGSKLDTFSFGHLSLYLVNGKYPQPYEPSLNVIKASEKGVSKEFGLQAHKRKQWLDQLGTSHCLYKLIVNCLQDEPGHRPSMTELYTELEGLCQQRPKTLSMVARLLEDEISKEIDSLKLASDEWKQQVSIAVALYCIIILCSFQK